LYELTAYFYLFDKIYVGNLWSDNFDPDDFDANTLVAQEQADVAREFYNRYGQLPGVGYGWYITMEVRNESSFFRLQLMLGLFE